MSASIGNINTKHIVEAVQILKNIYDIVRIVDPVQNTVIYIEPKNNSAVVHEKACFALWGKNKFCDNCVSFRAATENDTFIKFEIIDERIYMLTASPVECQGSCYVVEMMNDITDKGIIQNPAGKHTKDFTNFVLRMNDAVVRDELTKVFNRRYINERLPVEMFQSIAASIPAALIMVDIDEFKKKNDKYGHIAGDMILQQFAHLVTTGVQNNRDWVARYGGDEFLIYLHNADSKQSMEIAEQVRKIVEDAKFGIPDGIVRITCSMGSCTLEKKMDIQAWIESADKKLYVAKASGGNRVVV